jgi:hypothetical protein
MAISRLHDRERQMRGLTRKNRGFNLFDTIGAQ